MLTADFDFELPEGLIAQEPPLERTMARMMVLHRGEERIEHRSIVDLPDILRAGDRLVLNDTRVFSARAFGHWVETGGNVEVLFLEPDGDNWHLMLRSGRPPRPGQTISLADDAIQATVLDRIGEGKVLASLEYEGDLYLLLEEKGVPPVPPYIRRQKGGGDEKVASDRTRYQTVYAREVGAVAAPTAGLHFTPELLESLADAAVPHSTLTLHVGPGTFRPVKCERVEDHHMDEERYRISVTTAEEIRATQAAGGRIVAVGSTSVRTLESIALKHDGDIVAASGRSSLFIYPPYTFRAVDCMLTNFHLPRSSLIMMVSALAGREFVLRAYREAIQERYRFYSYGDCMLIL